MTTKRKYRKQFVQHVDTIMIEDEQLQIELD